MRNASVESRPDQRKTATRLRKALAKPFDVIVRYLAAFAEDDARPQGEQPAPGYARGQGRTGAQ